MDIWSLLRKNKATYTDLEKSVFSRKYLNAYENFDYSFDGPVFHPRWNRETFYAGTEKEQNSLFFQNVLDGETPPENYFAREHETVLFAEKFFKRTCYAFYSIANDSLNRNSPAKGSEDVLAHSAYLNQNNATFIKVRSKKIFEEICILGIREIALVYLLFPQKKTILIPDECRITVLQEHAEGGKP
jgi:hypothetical protein